MITKTIKLSLFPKWNSVVVQWVGALGWCKSGRSSLKLFLAEKHLMLSISKRPDVERRTVVLKVVRNGEFAFKLVFLVSKSVGARKN